MRYLVVLLVVSACATQPEMLWDKPGFTQADFNADTGQCRAQAFSAPGMPAMQVAMIFGSCMQGKGYHQRPAY